MSAPRKIGRPWWWLRHPSKPLYGAREFRMWTRLCPLWPRGHKLSLADRRAIVALADYGVRQRTIAKVYGVSQQAVSGIVRRWRLAPIR